MGGESFFCFARTAPHPLEKEIPVPMLVCSSSRIRAQPHHLPVVRRVVCRPVRCTGTIRVASPGKIGPEGLHQLGKLVVLGTEGCSLAQIKVAEDVFNLIRVECSYGNRVERISRRTKVEEIAVYRGTARLHLRF